MSSNITKIASKAVQTPALRYIAKGSKVVNARRRSRASKDEKKTSSQETSLVRKVITGPHSATIHGKRLVFRRIGDMLHPAQASREEMYRTHLERTKDDWRDKVS